MAYAIVASKWLGDKKYIEAVLDSAADLAALGDGYAPDSRAIVAEGGAAYMTDASGQWQELGSPGGGGGSSVTVEPLTVAQNGTTTAPSGKAYSPVTVVVPNPNYVETIKTVRVNEIPKETIARIHEGYITNALTAYVDTKNTTTGHAYWTEDEDELGTFSSATTSSGGGADRVWYASFLGEEDDFALYECKQTTNGTTWSDKSTQRIDIVIIHHPMPDSE